jgi:hypothetical protein
MVSTLKTITTKHVLKNKFVDVTHDGKKEKKQKMMQFEQNNTLFHVVLICYSMK